MKKIKVLILFTSLILINPSTVLAQDCSKLDKLSKEYAECNANLLKKNAKSLKEKASDKFKEGKNKFVKFKLKEKLLKFKNSKSHTDFIKK